MLIQFFTKAPSITKTENPSGMRLGIVNHEIYLDIPEKILKEYRNNLEEKILALGREIDTLNLRLTNPNYVKKAPAVLVQETRDQITAKQNLLEKMKNELSLI